MGIKVTRKWLDSIVDTQLSNDEIGRVLTQAGLELDEMHSLDPGCDGVVVGYVHKAIKHPNADKLSVCEVEVGGASRLNIVCGCKTVKAGIYVAVATVGTLLPNGLKIKKSKLRGEVSEGMLCSASEIGLNSSSAGIMHLAENSKLGEDIAKHLHLDDTMFDFDVTPNRGDCLSLHGVARELVAFSDSRLKPELKTESYQNKDISCAVKVSAPEDVLVYSCAIVKNIDLSAKVDNFIVEYLDKIGVGSVNNVVDIANYLMYEQGQPFHVFDADKVAGDIDVRFANDGEEVTVITGEKLSLDKDALVIADSEKIIAIAGLMGSADSCVDESTKNILVESAHFSETVIAKSCRRYKLNSDSAYRFERGVDSRRTVLLRDRLIELIIANLGGDYSGGLVIDKKDRTDSKVLLGLAYIKKVLGMDVSKDNVVNCLEKVGAKFSFNDDVFEICSPSWRSDLKLPIDYVEEVLRFSGYDNIPKIELNCSIKPLSKIRHAENNVNKLKNFLVANGLHEIISYSFISEDDFLNFATKKDKLVLLNPISKNMSYMRSTLVSGLLNAVSYNFKRQKSNIKLFEVGQVFGASGASSTKISACIQGKLGTEDWQNKSRNVSFYDLKGLLESMLAILGIDLDFVPTSLQGFHPGISANIMTNGNNIGYIGSIHPQLLKQKDLVSPVFIFEIDLTELAAAKIINFKPYSKFPVVKRDLSILVDSSTEFSGITAAVADLKLIALRKIDLTDIYTDDNMEDGQKSVTISFLFQDIDKTLKDEVVNISMDKIIAALQKINVSVRS